MEMDRPVKPSNLIFGLDDRPPMGTLLLLGLEHAFLLIASLVATIFPVTSSGNPPRNCGVKREMGNNGSCFTTIIDRW